MQEESKEDYMHKILDKDISIYFNVQHDDMEQFVRDLEKYGIQRTSMKDDFRVVVLRKTGAIIEVVGVDNETNELIANKVFDESGKFSGHSYVLDED